MTTLTSVLALREQPRGTYGGYHIKPFRNGRFWHVSIKNERGTHIIYCGRRSEERAVFEAVDTIRKWNRLTAVRDATHGATPTPAHATDGGEGE